MKVKNRGKIETAIIAVVILVVTAAVSVGVMASVGFFKSDKETALELLAQVPKKLSRSYVSDHVGTGEMIRASMEKGSSASVRLSGLKFNDKIMKEAGTDFDFSKFVFQAEIQTSADRTKSNTLLNLSKGDERLSVVAYMDEDKTCTAFPELSPGKVVVVDKREWESLSEDSGVVDLLESRMDYMTNRKYNEFGKAFEKFLWDEVKKVYDELSCKETEKDTYRLTVPKSALDTVFHDFYHFMSEQKETVDFLNMYLDEEDDLLSFLEEAVEKITSESSDFIFYVKGSEKDVSRVSFEVTLNGNPYSLSMDFEGKEDSKAQLQLKTKQDGENISLDIVMKDTKTDNLSESLDAHLLIDDISFGKLSYLAVIDPKDNKYKSEITLDAVGEEVFSIKAEGLVKNLNPGKSVSYDLKNVSLRVEGDKILSAAVNVTLGTLEGEIEPPKGEEIDGTDLEDPKQDAFAEEIMQNGFSMLSKWGLYDDEL
ncbi:MAG: hypothetical protein HFG38_03005 [Eubacterium sp.]|nr:hypothetical protein [Eubacterium sp.]